MKRRAWPIWKKGGEGGYMILQFLTVTTCRIACQTLRWNKWLPNAARHTRPQAALEINQPWPASWPNLRRVVRAVCGSVKDYGSDSMVPFDLSNVNTFSCSRDFVSKNIDTVSFVFHQYSIISTLIKFISSKMIAILRWPASWRACQV